MSAITRNTVQQSLSSDDNDDNNCDDDDDDDDDETSLFVSKRRRVKNTQNSVEYRLVSGVTDAACISIEFTETINNYSLILHERYYAHM